MADAPAAEAVVWAELVSRLERVLGPDDAQLGTWVGAEAADVAGWLSGAAVPPAQAQTRLRGLDTWAGILDATIVEDRIRVIVHDRRVPMLDGRTNAEALADGMDVDVIADLARSAVGWPCETAAGFAYLQAPGAPGPRFAQKWTRAAVRPG